MSNFTILRNKYLTHIKPDKKSKITVMTESFEKDIISLLYDVLRENVDVRTIFLEEGTINYEYQNFGSSYNDFKINFMDNKKNRSQSDYYRRYLLDYGIYLKLLEYKSIEKEELKSMIGSVELWYTTPQYLFTKYSNSLNQEEFLSLFNPLDLMLFFDRLSPEKKTLFNKITLLDKKLNEYKAPQDIFMHSDKPIIVIMVGHYIPDISKFCDNISNYFGDQYTYVLKIHPRNSSNVSLDPKCHIINNKIPAEAILLNYHNKIHAFVGQESSLFLRVPKNITVYLTENPNFEPIKSIMKEIINSIYLKYNAISFL